VGGSSSSRPRALLYRDMAGRVTVDAESETVGSAPRLGRVVSGGEWRAGGCLGVGGHERECPLALARSRWEGVEGSQKERARRKVDVMLLYAIVSKMRRTNLANLPAFATSRPHSYLHSRHVYA
jgi:hypothetical protein